MKPFEKEFYNLLSLTNLPQGDLQLNGGREGIVQGAIGTWGNSPGGNCLGGNCPGTKNKGGDCLGGRLAWE